MTGRRIAVIGGGISGLTAGYVLSRTDHVTLFEADRKARRVRRHPPSRAGPGRHRLHRVQRAHLSPADPAVRRAGREHAGQRDEHVGQLRRLRPARCGQTRPGLRGRGPAAGWAAGSCACWPTSCASTAPAASRWPGWLGPGLVPVRPTPLSTGPRTRTGRGPGPADAADDLTFGESLDHGGFSGYFQAHFALPLVAAVWSCPGRDGAALSRPAYLFAFLANHGMLAVSGLAAVADRHRGSRALRRAGRRRPDRVQPRTRSRVRRTQTESGPRRREPGVPFRPARDRDPPGPGASAACAADRAERECWAPSAYSRNATVLHTDYSALPRSPRSARRGTTCSGRVDRSRRPGASELRHDPAAAAAAGDYIVTLNAVRRSTRPRSSRMVYEHPIYTPSRWRLSAGCRS